MQLLRIAGAVILLTIFLAGIALGYKLGSIRLEKAINEALRINQLKVKEYEQTSLEYYQKYQDAVNREPVTITERVFVKAACPNVPTDSDRVVGADGITEGRAELHRDTVNRVAAVTEQARDDVVQCRIALRSVLKKVGIHNEQ